MLEVLGFMLLGTIFAYIFQKNARYEPFCGDVLKCGWQLKNTKQVLPWYLCLLILGLLFAGLRTVGNDTGLYVYYYEMFISPFPDVLSDLDWTIGANPGFHIFQGILKMFFGDNGLWLTFIVAIISCVSFGEFYRRYSQNFTLSIYLFIASTLFNFTMAAMKQILAMSIGIWLLPLAAKKKWIPFGILLALAVTIHPYVIFFGVIPFFIGKASAWKIKYCLILTLIIGANLLSFMQSAIEVTSGIGDEYDISCWEEGTGVNIYRLLFFLFTPILSIFCYDAINKSEDELMKTCVNLSYISACFMILASFGGAIMFGRMAIYWEPFTYVALPGILMNLKKKDLQQALVIGIIVCYFIFYLRFYWKYGWDLWKCYYLHANILDLFR